MEYDETSYGSSTQGPLHKLRHFGQMRSGADPGRAKIGQGGPLLKKTSSPDWNAIETNQMHSNDLEAYWKKCCYFWFHSKVKFLTCFHVFFDTVILPYFNASSIDFYEMFYECLINIYFV